MHACVYIYKIYLFIYHCWSCLLLHFVDDVDVIVVVAFVDVVVIVIITFCSLMKWFIWKLYQFIPEQSANLYSISALLIIVCVCVCVYVCVCVFLYYNLWNSLNLYVYDLNYIKKIACGGPYYFNYWTYFLCTFTLCFWCLVTCFFGVLGAGIREIDPRDDPKSTRDDLAIRGVHYWVAFALPTELRQWGWTGM